jgi:NAD(P)-dependent dehydrogenase (short-subunit alcohol dehydrogenase family)
VSRRILVTGGGSGIGLAIARRLGSCGDHVVLASRSLERLEEARGMLTDEASCCTGAILTADGGRSLGVQMHAMAAAPEDAAAT